ncbi:MAG: AAA family ATPase, partial [Planctomycetota bacterium]
FLDYSTLEKRQHYCLEEVRLDQRYAKDLYVGVVPITSVDGRIQIDGAGIPVEYAVKMHRFSDEALLSRRVEKGLLTTREVHQLAKVLADFHQSAERLDPSVASQVNTRLQTNAMEIVESLQEGEDGAIACSLDALRYWIESYFTQHWDAFCGRVNNGFIRECHGDLHLDNIVSWNEELVPFDGIEFNDEFRWIDVVSDAAFLAMDLDARGHVQQSRLFINSYLELTGDHASLVVLRWYLVYRALIRAMVARMKADQHRDDPTIALAAMRDCHDHINLAYRYTIAQRPTLFITHGLSGSGKTLVSEIVVVQRGAIRLRSDIERKRHFGISPDDPVAPDQKESLYDASGNHATYNRLERLASGILRDGYSVVIDATFLKSTDRERFHHLAIRERVAFAILDCHADLPTLRQRIVDRMAAGEDVSDADLSVLDLQVQSEEPLTETEREHVVDIPSVVDTIDHIRCTCG